MGERSDNQHEEYDGEFLRCGVKVSNNSKIWMLGISNTSLNDGKSIRRTQDHEKVFRDLD